MLYEIFLKKSCSLLDILRPASGRETLRRTPDGRRRHAGDAKQADPYRQTDRDLGLLSFGFGSAYIRFYSRLKIKNDTDGISNLNGMFITVFSVIAVITLLAGSILVGNVENLFSQSLTIQEVQTARILMILMVINLLNVPFYKRIWVLKPLVAALIPKWIMEKYHRIRLDKV